MSKLDKNEKKLADDFASGKFKKKADSRDFSKMAQMTKDSRINLRLQDDVLDFFQHLSQSEGIPYQTLINSILYKYAKGQLIETDMNDLAEQLNDIKEKLEKISEEKSKKRA